MEVKLSDMRDEICLLYLDDVLVYSQVFEDHMRDAEKVLRRLKKSGVKLKPSKCYLFQKEVRFLGQLVYKQGRPQKTVVNLKTHTPTTVKKVRQLLGLIGYFRRYIPDFSCLYQHQKQTETPKATKDAKRPRRAQPGKRPKQGGSKEQNRPTPEDACRTDRQPDDLKSHGILGL
jgi:hypothetical protein